MRFLGDMGVSRRVIELLRGAGHDPVRLALHAHQVADRKAFTTCPQRGYSCRRHGAQRRWLLDQVADRIRVQKDHERGHSFGT